MSDRASAPARGDESGSGHPHRISVVIPVRDDAAMLRLCLEALAGQTRRPDEIVVVDNDSTDDSAEIARLAGARVVFEPVHGILAATATGFDAADGTLLARLDADSIAPPDWLERVERHFAEDPGLAGFTGPGEFYGANPLARRLARVLYIGGYFWSMGVLIGQPPLFGSNLALRADAWRRVGGSVHRTVRAVHDDLDISFALLPGMRVRYDPSVSVAISARPFESLPGFGRRIWWAATTIRLGVRDHLVFAKRRARRRMRRAGTLARARADGA